MSIRPSAPRLRSLLGTPAIHPVLFILSKVAVFTAIAFPVLDVFGVHVPGTPHLAVRPAAVVVLLLGAAVLLASVVSLGASTRVGLPRETTELRTGGLYRLSRNPIYVGVYLLCAGAILHSPHWIVVLCGAAGAALHHRIVLAEEAFLDARFGRAWQDYRARVRRYL